MDAINPTAESDSSNPPPDSLEAFVRDMVRMKESAFTTLVQTAQNVQVEIEECLLYSGDDVNRMLHMQPMLDYAMRIQQIATMHIDSTSLLLERLVPMLSADLERDHVHDISLIHALVTVHMKRCMDAIEDLSRQVDALCRRILAVLGSNPSLRQN